MNEAVPFRMFPAVAVDSTFATPIGLRPVELGADYVVQSLTKYICGHGDAIGGAVLGRDEDLRKLRTMAIHMGGIISPFNAWLIMRGLVTLPLRMRQHAANALAVDFTLPPAAPASKIRVGLVNALSYFFSINCGGRTGLPR